ncbi:UPF0280 family protein [Xenophilus arseniciresistens]|uniref:UPF0280 family protein n=1 Tax=Xenophilus arseniciresistens TaxID=1283306 RepID=A0AAE3T1C4_9BURK|nr:UPF0280 family protein [Xenophilus arseniciresistens]MDA7419074.1 UPF0280 family protein [Xenophilus arseniciresistens]
MAATRHRLDARRWHFQHGPMDLVLQAEGEAAAVAAAHEAAWLRFMPLLDALVAELPALRQDVAAPTALQGGVARRMHAACVAAVAGAPQFITPMAAVAGAVADALIGCYAASGIMRAWVNNGGDIALHLAPGAQVRVGLFADLARFDPGAQQAPLQTDGQFQIDAAMPVRGVATSGWRGRSFSLGIADSVTVLAATGAQADAAATVIANAVDVAHPSIVRKPANTCKDNSDLGSLPVTVDVPALPSALVAAALARGLACAQALRDAGRIHAAILVCQGQAMLLEPLCSALRGAQAEGTADAGPCGDRASPAIARHRPGGDVAVGSVFA